MEALLTWIIAPVTAVGGTSAGFGERAMIASVVDRGRAGR
jgi:hypothetical protein